MFLRDGIANTQDRLPFRESLRDLRGVLEVVKCDSECQKRIIETGVFPRTFSAFDGLERVSRISRELEDGDLFILFGMLMHDQTIRAPPGTTPEELSALFRRLEAVYDILRKTVKAMDGARYQSVRNLVAAHKKAHPGTAWPSLAGLGPDPEVLLTLSSNFAYVTAGSSA